MGSFAANAMVAKTKAIYGTLLKAEDFEELSKKKSVGEIAAYLKNHPDYQETLADIQESSIHRGQLEELIKKNNFLHTLKVAKFVELKDKSYYHLNIIHREIDLILATIRMLISENIDIAIAEFPTYFIRHASFDITAFSRVRDYGMLLEAVKGTKYQAILEPYFETDRNLIKYSAIEQKLNSHYYDCVFERIAENYSGSVRKELEIMFMTRIELANIILAYRLKKFYDASPDEIENLMDFKHIRTSKKRAREIIENTDADGILSFLRDSEYARYADDNDFVYVEYFGDKIRYHLAKKDLYYSNSAPIVFSAFLIMEEIERQNLFHIIEGIRYGLPESEIRKMLIY
ncbi:MAG TPA: V-type ATPase subunit [Bacillota bacterium]|nr:V-type ATPase subunit [Bacillota bacterium]